MNWTTGTLAALVATIFICRRRFLALIRSKRSRSYSCPPKALITRWPAITSSATRVTSPMESWMRSLMRRKRRLT